jgi:rhombotail lipoprotein
MKILGIFMIVILLNACASKDMRPQLESGMGGIPTTQYSDAQTIEEIRKLRPQAHFPLKVAVMPPDRVRGISKAEKMTIEQWGEKLKQIGFVTSLEIVPISLMPSCGYRSESNCFLNQSRAAGARLGADAMLFIGDSTVTDSYINPLSILNLTIVGMWIVPAHHRDSYSVYEAALFDIDNGYLYAVAEGQGEQKSLLPYMYVEYSSGQEEARVKALNVLGEKLLALAQNQMDKLTEPNVEKSVDAEKQHN